MTDRNLGDKLLKRRQFVIGSAVIISSSGALTARADSHAAPRVSEDDPSAVGVKYVHDATTADPGQRVDGRFCSNCQLYTGDASEEWGPCAIFPGKVVASKGWCSAWAPKSSS